MTTWILVLLIIHQMRTFCKFGRLNGCWKMVWVVKIEDTLMSEMCRKILEKFDKYWMEYSVLLAFGVALDPRFKFKILEKLYAKVEKNPNKCQEKMELLKRNL